MHLLEAVRPRLAELAGVERVLRDDGGSFILVCRSGISRAELRAQAQAILQDAGVAGEGAFELLLRPEDEPRRRVRLDGVDVKFELPGITRVRVTLEWGGNEYRGESAGESGNPLELRTAAAAAVQALNRVTADSIAVRLVGVKQLRAFDADILVVALMSEESPPQKLVGAVCVGDAPHRAAAAAVLHATNRILGNYIAV
jgi:hypothetical protein